MAVAAAVLAKGKAVTSKLVPPNNCHCPSEAALKCQLMTNRDGGWGRQRQLKQVSQPGTEIPGHCPLSATTYTVVTVAAQERDGLTHCLFAQGTSSTAATTQLTWLDWKGAALAYDLITGFFSQNSLFPAATSPSYLGYKGPMVQTAFLLPRSIPGLLTY